MYFINLVLTFGRNKDNNNDDDDDDDDDNNNRFVTCQVPVSQIPCDDVVIFCSNQRLIEIV